jgi:aryl-alcohol dehydrogenase-like predicted oxidoreductase
MKLALGTAQFGMEYGIANKNGKVSLDEASAIITLGRLAGIDTLDTAMAYGDSEESLGKLSTENFHVITKLPSFGSTSKNLQEMVRDQVVNSLAKLKQVKLSGLLLHRPDELLSDVGAEIWLALNAVKEEGLVELIGYSIYSPDELDSIYSNYQPDIVQAPYNIIDRRLCSSGWIDRLHSDGVEIHVRSVFLQGLLLMEAASRPVKFDEWSHLWSSWDNWLESNNLSKLQGALQFALSNPKITKVVVGVDSAIQLEEIIRAAELGMTSSYPSGLSSDCVRLINPANWGEL